MYNPTIIKLEKIKENEMVSYEKQEQLSKFLSYVLRHKPHDIGLVLDANGWVLISSLIQKSKVQHDLTVDMIRYVVAQNKKQRFAISEDGLMIRANQGHTIKVDLDIPYVEPPKELYHGTATRFLASIQKEGLKAMNRHDVHLSINEKVAKEVGQRHGKVAILKINTEKMYQDGFLFKCTENNVWLTEAVPIQYINYAF